MEDGTKEDPAQTKEPQFLSKAGWLKKAPGRLLASYKDRYIQVERSEVVVYENEDCRMCLERLDLENYDKCLELKSTFKKKHRLILIRSPKSGNKVTDVKFQTQTAEEKEAWIKALSDGINRAKNKIFDEVKVGEGGNLEHVTRTRVKGNRNRRPPTRIHMKEVATVSSDGILRLDLDLEDALMPNGNHVSVDGTTKEAVEKHSESNVEKDGQNELKNSPQKKVIKPPMPPTKEAKSSSTTEGEPDRDDGQEKKVLKPPMPPSKEAKPSVLPFEEVTVESKADKISENSPDARKMAGPPPTPPNKPSCCSNLAEASQSASNSHPPPPPSKEWKPSYLAVEQAQEIQDPSGGNEEREEDKEVKIIALESDEVEESIPKKALLIVKDGEPDSPALDGHIMEEESEATLSSGIHKASDNEPQTPTEAFRKRPSFPLTPEKKPNKVLQSNTQNKEEKTNVTDPNAEQGPAALAQTTSDTLSTSPQTEEVALTVVSLNEGGTDSLSLSPVLCHSPREKRKNPEERSVDSSQYSGDNCGSEDPPVVSKAMLRGGHAGSDVVNVSEEDIQISIHSRPTQGATKPHVRAKAFPCQQSKPSPATKPSTKPKSVSCEDLLADSSLQIQVSQHTRAVAERGRPPSDDVTKLEAQVFLEMDKTSKLLSRVSQSQGCDNGDGMPEDLLATAMEKLKAADDVLREVRKLEHAKNLSNRKSW